MRLNDQIRRSPRCCDPDELLKTTALGVGRWVNLSEGKPEDRPN